MGGLIMALLDIPPWLSVTPNYFTSALEAGAHAGLALGEQAQRAQQLAEARAERQAQAQERADREAEQSRQFEETRLLNVQKIAQDAQALQQRQAHEAAQESRLYNFEFGKLALDQARANTQDKRNEVLDKMATLRLDQQKDSLDLRAKHYGELEKHNQEMLDLQKGKAGSLNPGQDINRLHGLQTGYIHELGTFPALVALKNPEDPKYGYYTNIQAKLKAITDTLENYKPPGAAPTVLAPTNNFTLTSTNAAPTTNAELTGLPSTRVVPAPARPYMTNAIQVPRPSLISTNAFSPPVGITSGLYPAMNAPVEESNATGTINPMPKSKSELVSGKIYDTPRGAARWDGSRFKLVEIR